MIKAPLSLKMKLLTLTVQYLCQENVQSLNVSREIRVSIESKIKGFVKVSRLT